MESNKMVLTFLAACSLGILTTGCSTVSKMVGSNDPDRMVEVEVSKEAVDEMQIPAWFIEKETASTDTLTVTATDVSKDMQFAIDKATLAAKIQLAQKLKTDVSSLARQSTLETGFGTKDVEKETDRVSKSVTRQSVAYYRRENLKIVRDGENYRAFVKLVLDIDEARRLTENPGVSNSREDRLKELDGLGTSTSSVLPPQVNN